MNSQQELSTQEWQLLSAYLDDQLSKKEKRQAEQLLSSRPDCQLALEELKRLQVLLRHMPMQQVPRNFTISSEATLPVHVPKTKLLLRISSIATAALLAFTLALDYLPALLRPLAAKIPSVNQQAAEPAPVPAAEMALKSAEEMPQIIYWGGMPGEGAFGKGGGGAEGMVGAPVIDLGYGGGMTQESVPETELLPTQEEMSALDEIPESEAHPPAEISEMEEAPAETGMMPKIASEVQTEQQNAVPVEGQTLRESAPILGVRPKDERGQLMTSGTQFAYTPEADNGLDLKAIQIFLTVLLIIITVPAWLLKRR